MSQGGAAKLPPGLKALGAAFLEGLEATLGENLVAIIFFGAAVFPESLPTGDVDFHVILKRPLSVETRAALEEFHQKLAAEHPPMGAEMDGYYLLLVDALRRGLPTSQLWRRAKDNAWALHRAHILAGRCRVLYGPDPETIYLEPSWDELEWALYDEMDYVKRHLERYPDYCILNLCRLLYSFETRDVVVSKAWAADWAWEQHSPWRPHIEAAKRSYAGRATDEDRRLMAAEARTYFEFADRRIAFASSQS